jgi:hypothetical protein
MFYSLRSERVSYAIVAGEVLLSVKPLFIIIESHATLICAQLFIEA